MFIQFDTAHFEGQGSDKVHNPSSRFGGYGFYAREGRPVVHYNAVGTDQFTVRGDTAIAPGKRRIGAAFAADTATPGTMTLFIDGKQVASGRIGRTVAGWMSQTEGLDIGRDTVTPVNNDYRVEDSVFTGGIDKVTVTIDAPDSTK